MTAITDNEVYNKGRRRPKGKGGKVVAGIVGISIGIGGGVYFYNHPPKKSGPEGPGPIVIPVSVTPAATTGLTPYTATFAASSQSTVKNYHSRGGP
jgi:hypothetical protein